MADERDLVQFGRLQSFNDAVFAIVATILILPIRKLEEDSQISLSSQLHNRRPQFLVYFVAFLVICSIWESHVHRFKILAHVDDVLVWLNLTSLMFTSFLPFTCALEGWFFMKYLPVMLICGDLLILELLEILMIMYCFHNEDLLKEELQDLPKEQRQERRNYMLAKKLLNPLLYIIAASVCVVSRLASWVVLPVVIFTPCINRFFGFLFRKCKAIRTRGSDFDRTFGNYIDVERVGCFSDGVFSIVATLLVLDITTENLPTESSVKKDGIDKTVLSMWPQFLVYIGTFVIIALLWFVHHSLFHCIKNMNQAMLVLNNISLACIGFFPYLVGVLNKFDDDPNKLSDDVKLAVQCSCVVTFVASITQAMVFITALCKSPFYLQPKANPVVSPSNHCYLALKLAVIPLVSLLVYYTTFATKIAVYVVFHSAVLATPLVFIGLKIAFGQREFGLMRHDIAIDPDIETWVPPPHRSRLRIQKKGQSISPSESIAV